MQITLYPALINQPQFKIRRKDFQCGSHSFQNIDSFKKLSTIYGWPITRSNIRFPPSFRNTPCPLTAREFSCMHAFPRGKIELVAKQSDLLHAKHTFAWFQSRVTKGHIEKATRPKLSVERKKKEKTQDKETVTK